MKITVENISRSISKKVWGRARINLRPLDQQMDSLPITLQGLAPDRCFFLKSQQAQNMDSDSKGNFITYSDHKLI